MLRALLSVMQTQKPRTADDLTDAERAKIRADYDAYRVVADRKYRRIGKLAHARGLSLSEQQDLLESMG